MIQHVAITEIHKDDEFYGSRFVGETGFAFQISDWSNGWKRFMFRPDSGTGLVGFYAAKFRPLLDAGEENVVDAVVVDSR